LTNNMASQPAIQADTHKKKNYEKSKQIHLTIFQNLFLICDFLDHCTIILTIKIVELESIKCSCISLFYSLGKLIETSQLKL